MKLTKQQQDKMCDILGISNALDRRYTYVSIITLDELNVLNDLGLLDLEQSQNDSPTIGEFMEFMEAHDNVEAHGYVITNREDARLSIEGLRLPDETDKQTIIEFLLFCKNADELSEYYSWWD
jgi:hypothetical protein